ncbi:MAG: VOC family protein [Anaerolineales bacterium]|nr:VOC family protein [Anaerolineales bacterium]MCB0019773.1 VOC family protein [Anaerolineales bacterium]MCB8961544.1 VOC family protein [Ardenticatenales bacterium]
MRIYITNVFVDDQSKALDFYTNKLGFKLKLDIPMGEHRWLTVVDEADGVQLLLEPSEHPAVGPYKQALVADGIPAASFMVDDLEAECARLQAEGVVFVQPLTPAGPVSMAVIDDTCGNLLQLIQMN